MSPIKVNRGSKMEIQESTPNVVLLLVDSNFVNLCSDPVEYISRLKNALNTRAERLHTTISLFTVSGKYGLSKLDTSINVIDIDDKNKTAFGQTLENASIFFEELVTISNTPNDPYMSMVREVATTTSKIMTQYKYERKAA